MSTLPERTVFVSGRIAPGTVLNGVYVIEGSLAPGGMGELYKGHESFSGKKVALKFIRRELEENDDARQMFVNEGNSLSELHHDAIVRCYPLSVDPTLKRLYLPMEFVEGPSLFDLMEAGPIPTEQVKLLLKRIGAGLQAAHELNIFHRDVSPDNIIVPDRDMARAKIIDFGIARAVGSGRATIIGSGFAGKHNYVSPEQCGLFGGDVQAPSDIYSLALVLAGALLGKPLDMGGSLIDVTAKRQVLPDLSTIDPSIRHVLEAMLQPDPAARPATMTAAADLLSAPPPKPTRAHKTVVKAGAKASAALPRAAPSGAAPRRSVAVLVGVALALVAVAGGAAFVFLRPSAPPTPAAERDPMRAFTRDYAPDRCVLLLPTALSATAADISGFAADPAALDGFSAAFEAKFGFKPNLLSLPITEAQCPALALARSAGAGGTEAPVVTVDRPATVKRSGRKVAGTIEAPAGSAVMLLRLDENGTVQDLSDNLRKADDAGRHDGRASWTFQPVLDRPGDAEGGAAPQALLAVASQKPLSVPPIIVTASSSVLLPALTAALPSDGTAGVAFAAFRLEK